LHLQGASLLGKAGIKTKKRKDNKELESYYSAVKQGVEPISTKQKDIDAALRLSNGCWQSIRWKHTHLQGVTMPKDKDPNLQDNSYNPALHPELVPEYPADSEQEAHL
jgi:hypothetical protein